MRKIASLEDLVGIGHGKLGHYQELQMNLRRLEKTNNELQESRAEIQTILDGLTDMMLVLTEEMKIVRTNKAFAERFPDLAEDSHCFEVFYGGTAPCDDCPALTALSGDSTVKARRLHEHSDGFRHYDIIATPLILGSARTVQVFYRDVTSDMQLQAKYNQAEKMATVGVLAAGVAHEINNPLAVIQGFAEGLQRRVKLLEEADSELLDDFNEYTATILSECSRCRDIVRNLLSFSRPVAARRSSLDINHCIRDTLFILKHHLKEQTKITLELNLDRLQPIHGDESQLKQVIINLCTNAIDAMQESGGRLFISSRMTTREQRKGVEFTVSDEGCGISPEDGEKLFEPFFTTKTVGEGVGIGLSTCYSIVASHNGEITVASTPGKGAAFTVFLPEEP